MVRTLLTLLFLLLATPAWSAAPEGPGWGSLRQAPFTFHYRDLDAGIARDLAARSDALVADLQRRTGLELPRHVDVTLAPDHDTFVAVQPSAPPVWAAGTAWSDRSEIYLRTRLPHTGPSPLSQTFVHEVVHIAVGRSFGERPPRWLNEGLAKLLAGELTPRDHALLTQATVAGRVLSLDEITRRWPRSEGRARLAYVQSTDFLAWLGRRGESVLPTLLASMSAGQDLEAAILTATGEPLRELEDAWRSRITFWHAWLPALGSTGVLWGLTSLLFLYAAWKRRRSFRQQMKAMGEVDAARQLAAQQAMERLALGWVEPGSADSAEQTWLH